MGNNQPKALRGGGTTLQQDVTSIKHLEVAASSLKVIKGTNFVDGKLFTCQVCTEGKSKEKLCLKLYKDAIYSSKSFWTETLFLRKLNHPNVTTLRGFVHSTEHVGVLLDFSDYGTLFDILHTAKWKKVRPLPLELVIFFAKDIAHGLEYLNSLGVIHRKLKSENIVVKSLENGPGIHLLLSDFGVAGKDDNEGDPASFTPAVTNNNQFAKYVNTLGVYAFGVLLWEMITCRVPMSYAPTSIGDANMEIPQSCPRELANIMKLCWHKDPDCRLTFNEILDALILIEGKYIRKSEPTGLPTLLSLQEKNSRMKMARLQRFARLMRYVQDVAGKNVDVTDLLIVLSQAIIVLQKIDYVDPKDLIELDSVLEECETILPNEVVEAKEQIGKLWNRFSNQKRSRAEVEKLAGRLQSVISRVSTKYKDKSGVIPERHQLSANVKTIMTADVEVALTKRRSVANSLNPQLGSENPGTTYEDVLAMLNPASRLPEQQVLSSNPGVGILLPTVDENDDHALEEHLMNQLLINNHISASEDDSEGGSGGRVNRMSLAEIQAGSSGGRPGGFYADLSAAPQPRGSSVSSSSSSSNTTSIPRISVSATSDSPTRPSRLIDDLEAAIVEVLTPRADPAESSSTLRSDTRLEDSALESTSGGDGSLDATWGSVHSGIDASTRGLDDSSSTNTSLFSTTASSHSLSRSSIVANAPDSSSSSDDDEQDDDAELSFTEELGEDINTFISEVKQHETSANRLQELQWDPDARLFWLKNFGSDTMVVSWQQFIKAMGSSIYVSPEDANNLKRIVDHNNADYVTIHTFAQFLSGNGPFSKCIAKMNSYCKQPWFHWYLDHDECSILLQHSPTRTFMVRFSKSNPGFFAVTVKIERGTPEKWLIQSHQGKLKANFAGSQIPVHDTLNEFVQYYMSKHYLKVAFDASWTSAPWFRGMIDGSEVVTLLEGRPPGTFLFRLSPNGHYFVCAYMLREGIVQEKVDWAPGRFTVENWEGVKPFICNTLPEFISLRSDRLRFPYSEDVPVTVPVPPMATFSL